MNKSTRTLKGLLHAMTVYLYSQWPVLLLALAISVPVANTRANSLVDNTISPDPPTRHHQMNGQQQQQQQQQPQHHKNYQLGRQAAPAANYMLGNQNKCQSGWMWFNNKCWVTTQSRRDFQHAVELCKKMYNSTLPTIHSEEENEFLRQNIDLRNSPIWLYARHNHQYNMTRWQDKTVVNFTHWDQGQPSDKSSLICIKTEDNWYMKKAEPVDGQTECVSFWEDGRWGTQVGCMVLLPVVCERKLAQISRHPHDGPNGTGISSQYEQQQMSAISAATRQPPSISLNLLVLVSGLLISLILAAPTTITCYCHGQQQRQVAAAY